MIYKDLGFAELLITDAAFGHVGADDPSFRDRLTTAGFADYPLVWMKQVHSAQIQEVDQLPDGDQVFADTDGLTTRQSGLRLVTKTADCVPILLWSEDTHRIAAIHCGWKGFLKGIIEAFPQIPFVDGSVDMKSFQAFLGPHIRTESFEVREDFIAELADEKRHLIEERDGKSFFNLTKGVTEALEGIGITAVEDCGIDSYEDQQYFSYRGWCHLPEAERPESYSTFASSIVIR